MFYDSVTFFPQNSVVEIQLMSIALFYEYYK